MERIPDKIDSKFRYVLLAAHRAEQLIRGAQPKVGKPHAKPTRTAMEEVLRSAVPWDYGPEPPPEDAGTPGVEENAETEPVEA